METLFFRNKRIVALAIFMILAAGLSALSTVGRQEDPGISKIFATVLTAYPGADPARVEALVTEKVEEELKQIPQIKKIESTSRTGISVVQVELGWKLGKAEIEQTWSEVRDALSDAARNFPQGVAEPSFDDDRIGAFSAISAVHARPGVEVSPAVLKRYAELLQDRLRELSGTQIVETYGARNEEILVDINPRKLTSMGLTPAQVSAAIAGADTKIRSGQIRGQGQNLLIETKGEIKSLERIRNIPINGGNASAIVRVSDVAIVTRSVREPATSLAYTDGTPAILVAAKIENNIRVDLWMQQVKAIQAKFAAELPGGLVHKMVFDQSLYTADRLQGVLKNLMIGISLVVAVLFITLGWRAALIVAAILPLASFMSLAGLQLVGIPIHQMSITGLIVALGLLVDAGIVMTDEIRKKLEQNADRQQAVRDAVKRLAVPLLASTVTTALAFVPMAILPGPPGDFIGAIAVSVIIMLISSLVLALTITPALSGWFLSAGAGNGRAGVLSTGMRSERLGRWFAGSLKLAVNFPKLAILGALVLPLIGFAAMPTLKAQFFPGVDRDQFYVQVKLPGGTAIGRTRQSVTKAEKLIRKHEDVRHVHWVVGESAPAFYYNMQANQDGEASFAEALITTASPAATEHILPTLQREFDAQMPEARVTARGLVQGPPVAAPVEIRVVGPDIEVLRQLGDQLRTAMVSVPDVIQAKTQLTGGAPKISLDIDEEKARLAGLNLSAIARQLESGLEGAVGGSLVEASEELPVRLRVGTAGRSSIDVLRGMDVVRNDAASLMAAGIYPGVPLSALGSIRLVPSESPIFRRDGERINTVQGYTHRTVLPEEALKKVQAAVAKAGLSLPAGYRFEVGGDSDARNDVLRDLLAVAGIVIALTIATIVLTFNSFRLSLVTAAVSVLAMGLSLLVLAVFKYPLGVMAIIGVIGSIGVSINAAIIILTALQKNAAAAAGSRAAIVDTVAAQSRHIVSTTITTFGGFLPLILAGGGFWPPFAMAIAGGVLLSTVVSFYFVPPAFALLNRPKAKDEVKAEVLELSTENAQGAPLFMQAAE
ncbi:MAG: efflux RND transporter permease subunit [Alphaproteobacteria bacterium]|nr:efflux RND transporter permease subunit [Alphaproteobacteria bacterium]